MLLVLSINSLFVSEPKPPQADPNIEGKEIETEGIITAWDVDGIELQSKDNLVRCYGREFAKVKEGSKVRVKGAVSSTAEPGIIRLAPCRILAP